MTAEMLKRAGYSPRTLNLELRGRELFGSLSSEARVFLFLALELEGEGAIAVGQLYGKRWLEVPSTMERFRALSEAARIEVLGFVTLMLHEVTHHLDFLSTPFGLNFHVKTMREYWSMQDFAPILLENPELIPQRFVDFGSHWDRVRAAPPEDSQVPRYSLREQDSAELKKAWDCLRGQILTFEAWGDAGKVQPHESHIVSGWSGRTETLKLFNRELVPVTVHGFLATVKTGDQRHYYLRPLTIFETRAAAHSMLWVIHLLGDDGADMLPKYFATFCKRAGQAPDYFFLFDLMASGWGFGNFEELLQKADRNLREDVLHMLSGACWYALHAPPPMDQDAVLNSNPIVRLLLVFMAYDDFVTGRNKRAFTSFVELADAIDQSTLARQWGFRPIQDILGFCRQMVETMMLLNKSKTWNPHMRAHFQHILELLSNQFDGRDSYTSHLGMPECGNPFIALDSQSDRKLLDVYEPPEEVVSWFIFRNNVLFKYQSRPNIIEKLEQHFGMNELVMRCSCGTVLSGRMSRYAGRTKIPCAVCGRIYDVDPARLAHIDTDPSTQWEGGEAGLT